MGLNKNNEEVIDDIESNRDNSDTCFSNPAFRGSPPELIELDGFYGDFCWFLTFQKFYSHHLCNKCRESYQIGLKCPNLKSYRVLPRILKIHLEEADIPI
jgi:hypothetical protein